MAVVVTFFQDVAFDPETTSVMGDAFGRACQILNGGGQPDLVKEIIAKGIIAVARDGERDPIQLCERALKVVGIGP